MNACTVTHILKFSTRVTCVFLESNHRVCARARITTFRERRGGEREGGGGREGGSSITCAGGICNEVHESVVHVIKGGITSFQFVVPPLAAPSASVFVLLYQ
jgi:hypothetical protein